MTKREALCLKIKDVYENNYMNLKKYKYKDDKEYIKIKELAEMIGTENAYIMPVIKLAGVERVLFGYDDLKILDEINKSNLNKPVFAMNKGLAFISEKGFFKLIDQINKYVVPRIEEEKRKEEEEKKKAENITK